MNNQFTGNSAYPAQLPFGEAGISGKAVASEAEVVLGNAEIKVVALPSSQAFSPAEQITDNRTTANNLTPVRSPHDAYEKQNRLLPYNRARIISVEEILGKTGKNLDLSQVHLEAYASVSGAVRLSPKRFLDSVALEMIARGTVQHAPITFISDEPTPQSILNLRKLQHQLYPNGIPNPSEDFKPGIGEIALLGRAALSELRLKSHGKLATLTPAQREKSAEECFALGLRLYQLMEECAGKSLKVCSDAGDLLRFFVILSWELEKNELPPKQTWLNSALLEHWVFGKHRSLASLGVNNLKEARTFLSVPHVKSMFRAARILRDLEFRLSGWRKKLAA